MKKIPAIRYKQIYNELLHEILCGKLPAFSKMENETVLAEKYKVSRTTVRSALKKLQDENYIIRTKRKGTTVSPHATECSSMDSVALILPDKSSFCDEIMAGAIQCAKIYRYGITPFYNHNSIRCERELLQSVVKMNFCGLIVYPCSALQNIDLYNQLVIDQIPFILMDTDINGIDAPIVICDNEVSMFDMTTRVIRAGHRNIAAFPIGLSGNIAERMRFKGFCRAHAQNGVPMNHAYFEESQKITQMFMSLTNKCRNSKMEKKDSAMQILADYYVGYVMNLNNPPTAIVCMNDMLALKIINSLEKKGYAVPSDVSVTGFDDIEHSQFPELKIATVRQNFSRQGYMCVEEMHNMLTKGVVNKMKIIPTVQIEGMSLKNI